MDLGFFFLPISSWPVLLVFKRKKTDDLNFSLCSHAFITGPAELGVQGVQVYPQILAETDGKPVSLERPFFECTPDF